MREPIKVYKANFQENIFPTAYCMPKEVEQLEKGYLELEAENKKLAAIIQLQGVTLKAVKAERDELKEENKKSKAALKSMLDAAFNADLQGELYDSFNGELLDIVQNLIKKGSE